MIVPPLLGSNDPPPFTLFNAKGTAPLVLTCDHASPTIPHSLSKLGLSESALTRHIALDIGAEDVACYLATALDSVAVLAGYSRLVVDCNRHIDDPSLILGHSDGVDVLGNRQLASEHRLARI